MVLWVAYDEKQSTPKSLTFPTNNNSIMWMSRELKKLKGGKDLATKVSNHPNFLKLSERGLKKLVKKIQKEK